MACAASTAPPVAIDRTAPMGRRTTGGFPDQRKRALHARMAAGTGGHGDQAVGALFDRLVREERC